MFTREPRAVYPSLPPSTVSGNSCSLSLNLLISFTFLDADVCHYGESWNCTDKAMTTESL